MRRLLVLGTPALREQLGGQLEQLDDVEVVDCDPALGDCVMYVRLESARYDAFFFVGFDHPVTRGALPVVAECAVLIPLVNHDLPDPTHDAYLFRLPKALGFRDERERETVLSALPKASAVPSCIIGLAQPDLNALARLARHATDDRWAWDAFVQQVQHEERSPPRRIAGEYG